MEAYTPLAGSASSVSHSRKKGWGIADCENWKTAGMAGDVGFEPTSEPSKGPVLPLNESPVCPRCFQSGRKGELLGHRKGIPCCSGSGLPRVCCLLSPEYVHFSLRCFTPLYIRRHLASFAGSQGRQEKQVFMPAEYGLLLQSPLPQTAYIVRSVLYHVGV